MNLIPVCLKFDITRFVSLIMIAVSVSILTPDTSATGGISGSGIENNYPNAGLLIHATELEYLIRTGDQNIVLVDMRRSGFENGHIPGSINIPGPAALTDPGHEIQNYLMNEAQFSELMGSLGITHESNLVIYDEGDGLGATRLFYALEVYGHSGKIRLLNGGLASWIQHEFPLEQGPVMETIPVTYEAKRTELLVCDLSYIREHLNSSDILFLDVRSTAEYEGRDRRARRAGSIPGAVNLEWHRMLHDEGTPYFLPEQTITKMMSDFGITPDKQIIPYCQSNVRGAHVYFTLRLMGFNSACPYEGSWTEYGNLEDTPIE